MRAREGSRRESKQSWKETFLFKLKMYNNAQGRREGVEGGAALPSGAPEGPLTQGRLLPVTSGTTALPPPISANSENAN